MSANVWDDRAEAYRQSEAHREGPDLDLIVEWAEGARTAAGRRAPAAATSPAGSARPGSSVVTVDPAPGMQADVQAAAEDLPFADGSFDVAACRVAAHHFADVAAAVRELARVAADRVLVVDNLFMGEAAEEAERLRDPSHVRNYRRPSGGRLFEGAGLRGRGRARRSSDPIDFEPRGSSASAAPATTPSACARSWPTGSRTAGSGSTGSRSRGCTR